MYCQILMQSNDVNARSRVRRGIKAVLGAVAALALLSACTSGSNVNIAFSQPVDSQTADYGIAYVKRTLPTAAQVTKFKLDDLRQRTPFFFPADLYLLKPASQGSVEVNITSRVAGVHDIKDVDVSSDGTMIIFAMRTVLQPTVQKLFDPPFWNIYVYTVATDSLQALNPTVDPTGVAAQYISPHFLPDGTILFASTLQFDAGGVLVNEGKEQFPNQEEDLQESAFDLHVMNTDGTNVHQITFNASHDVDATVLQSGRVMWSRWDHASNGGMSADDGISLYSSEPDGTDVELLFGRGSHITQSTNPQGAAACPAALDCSVQFVSAREMPSGSVLALVRPETNADFGGNLQIINVPQYAENNQPLQQYGAYPSTAVALSSATQNNVLTAVNTTTGVPLISPGGRFSSAFPLWDGTGRILVTWSECRLQNTAGTIMPCSTTNLANTALTEAPELYSAWMFDPSDNTFAPVVVPVEGVMITNIVALQPRPSAPAEYAGLNSTQLAATTGTIDIRSVYDWDGSPCNTVPAGATACAMLPATGITGIAQTYATGRPARFLRIETGVSIPSKQVLDFDKNDSFAPGNNYMREIVGYVPIEPDGSVVMQVPANIPFQISVVDINGNRIFPAHTAWLQVRPTEVIKCNGCHVPPAAQMINGQAPETLGVSSYSHGRAGLFATAWSGALTANMPFPGQVTTSPLPACPGDTMAETLTGATCGGPATSAQLPALNIEFNTATNINPDPWFGTAAATQATMPASAAALAGNPPVDNSYGSTAFTTPPPLAAPVNSAPENACIVPVVQTPGTPFDYHCRLTINYDCNSMTCPAVSKPMGLQALWVTTRSWVGGGVGPNGTTNATCNSAGCHTATVSGGAGNPPIPPAANLVLDDTQNVNPNQDDSYAQLLKGAAAQNLTYVDGMGNTQTVVVPARGPDINVGSALSSNFFQVFTNPPATPPAGYVNHVGLLSPVELRMVSEWADIGAQYYNNPFNSPPN
jgi:Hydrazine synthase alpha subunit middle domain